MSEVPAITTDHEISVQVDESGAGSAGIRQYIRQVSTRLSKPLTLRHTGRDGSKVVRTLKSVQVSWRHKPEIFWATAPSFALALARAKTKVLTVHDLRPLLDAHGDSLVVTTYRKMAFRSAINSANRIICVSERTLDDLGQLFPLAKSRAVVIPLSGERSGKFKNEKSGQISKTVSVIAHEHNKQAQRVLPAIKFLDVSIQVNFLCGNYTAIWHEHVAEIPNAQVVGFLSDSEYVHTILKSQAVVMLSNFEGFGIPIVEAQRLAIPVVISEDKALVEISSPDAFLVRSTDSPEQIANTINEAMSKSGMNLQPGRYDERTWNDVAAETVGLFLQP